MAANNNNGPQENVPPANPREAEAELKSLLIDLVRQHPLIYDKSHPQHFRTNARNEVWAEIGGILGIPGKLKVSLNCSMKFRSVFKQCRLILVFN